MDSLSGDKSLTSIPIKDVLKLLWFPSPYLPFPSNIPETFEKGKPKTEFKRGKDYGEEHHLQGKPREVVELYRILDEFCKESEPSKVQKNT